MTLADQLWGSTNEKIHTLGTVFLVLSAGCFAMLGMEIKTNGLLTFTLFAVGVNLIGVSMLRNAWCRVIRGEDSLVLLKKRALSEPIHSAAVHVGPWRVQWTGRVAHVDVGQFEIRRHEPDDKLTDGSLLSRSYQIFRAYYWRACSSVLFQVVFGFVSVGYGLWLLSFLITYQGSTV